MVVLFLGKKGSGKSALCRKIVYRRLLESPRALTLYHDPACQIRAEAGKLFTSCEAAREALKRSGVLPQLCVFRGVEVDDLARFAMEVRDCTLVIDELDRACNGKEWRSQHVRRIVHEGRHERVDLFGTFRSTRNVSEDIINAADAVFLFRHSQAAVFDLRIVEQRLGLAYAEACQGLGFGQFLTWSDDWTENT